MSSVRGDRIKELRKKKGLTQEDIALKLGINRVSYSHYESNKNTPPGDKLGKLADILNTSTDYLLGKTDSSDPIATQYLLDLSTTGEIILESDREAKIRKLFSELSKLKSTKSKLKDENDFEIYKEAIASLEESIEKKQQEIDEFQNNYPYIITSRDKNDLKKFLEQSEIMFDGVPLTDEEKSKVQGFMESMFWDAKKRNKRNK